jgi:arginyl-tRNA--protein-N-Asp/Glu arginylyltransferase
MSKSIYEEALDIMINSILPRESNKTAKMKVMHALQQAQKQEELLELYRKYFNVTEHWYETNNSGNIRKETAIEIEKLESELENDNT